MLTWALQHPGNGRGHGHDGDENDNVTNDNDENDDVDNDYISSADRCPVTTSPFVYCRG